MPLPVNLICTQCNRDGLHQWLGSKWLSLCCRAEWSALAAKALILYSYDRKRYKRNNGGYHQVSKYARHKA